MARVSHALRVTAAVSIAISREASRFILIESRRWHYGTIPPNPALQGTLRSLQKCWLRLVLVLITGGTYGYFYRERTWLSNQEQSGQH